MSKAKDSRAQALPPRVVDGRGHDFFIVDNAVVDERIERITERRRADALAVYAILARLADNRTGETTLRLAYLEAKTGRSKPIIIDALRELAREGVALIAVRKNVDDGGHRAPSTYVLLKVEAGTTGTASAPEPEPEPVTTPEPEPQVNGVDLGDEPQVKINGSQSKQALPHTKTVSKKTNDSPNGLSAAGASDEPPAPVNQKTMGMGQYGISQLKDRIKAAREAGARVHMPTARELKDYGGQFKACAADGHDLDDLLAALDYMVAKAAGKVEGEPKAWPGYRTALDRVLDGRDAGAGAGAGAGHHAGAGAGAPGAPLDRMRGYGWLDREIETEGRDFAAELAAMRAADDEGKGD